MSRIRNIRSGLSDPCFDSATGFDVCDDNKFIDYVNLGMDGNLKPIDEIYVNQDSRTQEFFGNIIRTKLSKNKFKPNLIVDSRQIPQLGPNYNLITKSYPGYRNSFLQIKVDLREQVLELNNGDREYQFYISIDMSNVGAFQVWDKIKLRFIDTTSTIGIPREIFTFRDTIESQNSIWAGPPLNIQSPKDRGLELMREPFEKMLDEKIQEFNEYIDTSFNGRLRKKLQRIDLYLTTEPRQDFNPFGNQVFTKMTNFVNLQ